jgi:hypothetical protein
MLITIGIKSSIAMRAMVVAGQVFSNGHFVIANATKNCFCPELSFTPYSRFMTGDLLVTFIAGIILVAAFEFYSDHIQRRMIMHTAGVLVNKFPFYNRCQIAFH